MSIETDVDYVGPGTRVGDAEGHERDPGGRNHTKEQRATER